MVIGRRLVVALGLLLVTAPAWAQTSAAGGFQGFNVVLVLGDLQDGATSSNIAAPARAALADLKDFLPYRSYRVLDTSWVLASSSTRQAVTSRLAGLDEQHYEVELDRLPVGPSTLQVKFAMREADGNAERRLTDREAVYKRQMDQLVVELQRAESAQNRSEIDAIRARLADIEFQLSRLRKDDVRYMSGGATMIDTSFTMSLGETVVVGTSRMRGGDKALIVLLTAVTRK